MATETNVKTGKLVLGHRLTEPQQRFLLSLPADGNWKLTTAWELQSYGKNALRGFGQTGLIEGLYRDPMQHRLTDEGLRVVRALAQTHSGSERLS